VSGWASPTVTEAEPRNQARRGGISVQVAAVRSQSKARSIAKTVNGKIANGLSGKTAQISKVSMGNFGTMYRVELGPFQNERETSAPCAQLRRSGLDCLVIK